MGDFNRNFTFAIFTVCLISAVPHGYHMGVMNVLHNEIKTWIKTEKDRFNFLNLCWSLTVGMFPAGAAIGSLFVNRKTGPQTILFYSGFLTVACQVVMNLCKEADSFVLLTAGRFFMGVSIGVSAGSAVIYMSEVSSTYLRGLVAGFYQFFVTMSVFYAQICGLPQLFGNDKQWIIAVMVATVPCVWAIIAVKFCPESPKHVVITENNEAKAMVILSWFKRSNEVALEMGQLLAERNNIALMPEITINNIWSIPLLVCFVLVISEQLCGVGILIYFSSEIFESIGLDKDYSRYASASMGASMLCGVIFFLCLVEIAGRRPLYLTSLGSLVFITIFLTCALILTTTFNNRFLRQMVVGCVDIFAFMYGLGVGPIRWLIIVEIFNYQARPLVASLVLPANFLINWIVAQTFLLTKESFRYYLFFIPCIFFDVTVFLFAFYKMPETLVRKPNELQMIA